MTGVPVHMHSILLQYSISAVVTTLPSVLLSSKVLLLQYLLNKDYVYFIITETTLLQ